MSKKWARENLNNLQKINVAGALGNSTTCFATYHLQQTMLIRMNLTRALYNLY
jgi:hypothetical protein